MIVKANRTYDVTFVEVVVHRTRISASGIVEANELARDLWDESPSAFETESLGRTDLIIADHATGPPDDG